jgi:hypothetical protein
MEKKFADIKKTKFFNLLLIPEEAYPLPTPKIKNKSVPFLLGL